MDSIPKSSNIFLSCIAALLRIQLALPWRRPCAYRGSSDPSPLFVGRTALCLEGSQGWTFLLQATTHLFWSWAPAPLLTSTPSHPVYYGKWWGWFNPWGSGMLVALGLPQLGDGAGTAVGRMADDFCTLNLHGLGVPMGKPISETSQPRLARQRCSCRMPFIWFICQDITQSGNPLEISTDVSSALMGTKFMESKVRYSLLIKGMVHQRWLWHGICGPVWSRGRSEGSREAKCVCAYSERERRGVLASFTQKEWKAPAAHRDGPLRVCWGTGRFKLILISRSQ